MFVPTTNVWDVSQIYQIESLDPQLRELLVRMYQNLNKMSVALNLKDTGYYGVLEYVCGQQYFPLNTSNQMGRGVYRKTFNIGALPNTSTLSTPHDIVLTDNLTFTRIYGVANDTAANTYLPLPYVSATAVANNIEVYVDATNINIVTGSNRTNYTTNYIVLEYIKT